MGVDNAKAAWGRDHKGDKSKMFWNQKLPMVPKVWLCWLIFAIKIGCAPLNLIFGGLFYHDSTEEPHLPPLMIAGGLFEVIRQKKMFDSAPQFSAICVCSIISGYRSRKYVGHHHGLPAYSHHDKIPLWWGNVSNDKDGKMSVTKSHHT